MWKSAADGKRGLALGHDAEVGVRAELGGDSKWLLLLLLPLPLPPLPPELLPLEPEAAAAAAAAAWLCAFW